MKALAVSLALLAGSAVRADTIVTFSFDDTFEDQMQAVQIFADAGVHGTFYVNSARLGQNSFLTLDQVLAMQAAGNEIGGHTTDHLSLGVVPLEEEERQICDDRAALLGLGLQVASLAYPHGSAPLATQQIVNSCGYTTARNSSGLRSHDPEGCTSCPFVETTPPGNPYALRTPASIKSYMTVADLQQNVLDAEANGGGWVPFVMHHVCDGCNTDAVSPAVLQGFVTWVAARQAMGTTVKTVQQAIGGPVNAAVLGQAPVPFLGGDGNLVRNGDLEVKTNTGDLPDCIEVLTGGANGTDYTVGLAPVGHSGTSAAQIEFLPGKSGTPRLTSLQDLGYCAPPAHTGDRFVFSFYYQSSDAVAPVAYYRIASGWWKTLAQGPTLPAAAAWTASSWSLPDLPADATAISVGVTILTTGSLAVDDFYLMNLNAPPPPDLGTTFDLSTPFDAGTTHTDAGIAPIDASVVTDGGVPIYADASVATGMNGGTSTGGCAMTGPHPGNVSLLAFFLLLVLCGAPR